MLRDFHSLDGGSVAAARSATRTRVSSSRRIVFFVVPLPAASAGKGDPLLTIPASPLGWPPRPRPYAPTCHHWCGAEADRSTCGPARPWRGEVTEAEGALSAGSAVRAVRRLSGAPGHGEKGPAPIWPRGGAAVRGLVRRQRSPPGLCSLPRVEAPARADGNGRRSRDGQRRRPPPGAATAAGGGQQARRRCAASRAFERLTLLSASSSVICVTSFSKFATVMPCGRRGRETGRVQAHAARRQGKTGSSVEARPLTEGSPRRAAAQAGQAGLGQRRCHGLRHHAIAAAGHVSLRLVVGRYFFAHLQRRRRQLAALRLARGALRRRLRLLEPPRRVQVSQLHAQRALGVHAAVRGLGIRATSPAAGAAPGPLPRLLLTRDTRSEALLPRTSRERISST